MPTLYWDIETRSTCDIRKAGVYRYATDTTTEVLLAAWCVDDGPVRWARIDDPQTLELRGLLADPGTRVVAHNAGFERLLLTHVLAKRHGWPIPPLERWDCTAARAARQALPRSLDGAANALGLNITKDREGHALMMRMCKPRKPRLGEDPKGLYWWEDAERMARLGAYCMTDVEVERLLDKTLKPMTPDAAAVWRLTERVNDRGVPVDTRFVNNARWLAHEAEAELNWELSKLTDGKVPSATNLIRLRAWLLEKFGLAVLETADEELNKQSIQQLIARPGIPADAKRALELRLEAGKSSVAKFQSIIERVSDDDRVRGNLVYHGASTGRYAGAGVQLQNMPRKTVKNFEQVKADVRDLPIDKFVSRYGPALNTLSQTLRGSICAHVNTDTTLMWADYAAVEARGVAWLAGADDMVRRFREDGAIYEEMAAAIFNAPADTIQNPSTERFIGKTVILGCGYGMGAKKFRDTCAAQGQAISEDLAERAVKTYRAENPEIPALWKGLEQAAIAAVENEAKTFTYSKIAFRREKRWLMLRLPSGRILWYRNPRIVSVQGPYGERPVLEYDAVNSMTKRWGPEKTWGGKLTENAVQGLCFDLMVGAMHNLEAAGYPVIMSVHDEIICEVPRSRLLDGGSVAELIAIMCQVPDWARDFPLKAEGKSGVRYGK